MNNNYMELALSIAYEQMGLTSPNPPVGAVLVKNNTIISSGGTCSFGSNHAEVEAINNANISLKDAEIYVTLEPCSHCGKTPPCTEAIIKAGISRVYIPLCDPNPLVAGKGVRRLRDAGIKVTFLRQYTDSAFDIIRPFTKFILKKKPYLLHKSAVTLDGRIATKSGDSKWISSETSRHIAHKLRAKVDAVIIGKNTLVADDPRLDVRFEDYAENAEKVLKESATAVNGHNNYFLDSLVNKEIHKYHNPIRIVIGLPESLSLNENIFFDDNYYIFERKERIDKMMKVSNKLKTTIGKLNIQLLNEKDHLDNVAHILEYLYQNRIMFAMIEGGSRITGTFFDKQEIDQFLYFICPIIAGNGLPSISGIGTDSMSEVQTIQDVSSVMINHEVIINGYKEQLGKSDISGESCLQD